MEKILNFKKNNFGEKIINLIKKPNGRYRNNYIGKKKFFDERN